MTFKNIISDGQIKEFDDDNILSIIESLREHHTWFNHLPIDDILDFFQALSEFWKNDKLFQKKFGNSLEHITHFISKENLLSELTLSLRGNYKVLDTFQPINNNKQKIFHAQPRGVTVHWIAGNVAILGIFSIIQALITKNVCLVKVPHNYEILRDVIRSFNMVNTDKIKGNDILKCIALVYIEKNDTKNQQIISFEADARIAWGGKEAIESILSLKKKFYSEDIVFGPKYSYVIIDSKSLNQNAEQLSQKLALDVSVFDQFACNSPHTILLEKTENNEQDIKEFLESLGNSMNTVNRLIIPKQNVSQQKAMDIHSLRAEYDFKGEVISSENTDWTIIFSEEDGLAEPCFSRVVFVRTFKNIKDLEKLQNRKIQSIGLEISDISKKIEIANKITSLGGDRCPRIGMMSLYSSPWDGMFTIDRLVRWIPLDI